eukprot:SRR837773.19481.p2 GENE.SRR837773.19481~~SRR837773.19481.p2  ORF type:complete len:515 (-),score=289.46 SRR837773.19481:28-1422(-)
MGLGLGDTVRIGEHVGLVGCQDPASPGKVCLEGKGCYDPEELRPVNTLVFIFNTLGGAAVQIFGAIKDDVQDAWEDLHLSLASFANSVSNKITDARAQVAEKVNFCAPGKREESGKAMGKLEVQTRSRLAILVDSAVERWGNLKEGVKAFAVAAKAKLVKIANQLKESLSEFYDAHLKDIVEALQRYLGGIAAAVTDVPDELNPLAGGPEVAAKEVAAEPSGLSQAIEGFVEKAGELAGKVREFSQQVYEKMAEGFGALMSGTGRLIAAASQRWAAIRDKVQELAVKATEQVKQWGRDALEFACNFDVKKTAQAAWAAIQEAFEKAMDAVKRGYSYVKQSLQDTAASLAAMVTAASVTIKEKSVATWESDAVQGMLETIKEEIRVLKELIAEQLSLVGKFVGGFMRYFGRFVPRWVKDKFKSAAEKAKEQAQKIQAQIKELMGKVTDGEAETVEVDAEAATVDV